MIEKIEEHLESLKGDALTKFLNELRESVFKFTPYREHPVSNVMWVHIDEVVANDYNPNSVAIKEMELLTKSIEKDGYTQPVVVVRDEEVGKYVIVDGFHRTAVMKNNKEIQKTTGAHLPVVVIDKDINDRMASTVRHNRARGTHSVVSMSEMVFSMAEKGWKDSAIANELGMEAEEVARLKHVTGFSKLFNEVEYSKSWATIPMLRTLKEHEENE